MDKKENKKILKLLISVGLPIAIQNLLGNGVNLLDNFMVANISEDALSAVSMANKSYFIFALLLFGLISGIGIFSAQYFGNKEYDKIHSLVGLGLVLATSFAILTTITILIFPSQTVRIFMKDEKIVQMGADYLKIAVFSFIPTAISIVYQVNLRSIRMTKIPMLTSSIAVFINGFLNYVLIFGKLGLPAMGIRGAALATVIARYAELFIVLSFIYKGKDNPLKAKIKDYFNFNKDMISSVLTRSLPVILQEGLWAIGTSVYFVAYGKLSSASVAAVQISLTTMDIFISLFIGLGAGAGVLIGNLLGEKKVEKAWYYSKRIIFYQIILSLPITLLYILLASKMLPFLNFTDESTDLTLKTIYTLGAYLPIKCMNFLFIVGVLRGGGDTKFNMLIETLSVWLIGVPMAFYSVMVLQLPVYYCLALVSLEEVAKLILSILRYRSRKWINVLV